MSKSERICGYCGESFPTIFEHMSHITAVHDKGFRKKEDRLRRASYCWSCASEIQPNETHCRCGKPHPRLR